MLIANPRDIPTLLKALRQNRFTAIIGVNQLFGALLDAPGFAEVELGQFKERAGVPEDRSGESIKMVLVR